MLKALRRTPLRDISRAVCLRIVRARARGAPDYNVCVYTLSATPPYTAIVENRCRAPTQRHRRYLQSAVRPHALRRRRPL